MKTLFIYPLILLFISTPLFGYFTFSDGKMIAIRGESCQELEAQAEAILDWSHRLGEHENGYVPTCYCSDGGRCFIDVYGISPEMVQEYQGVKPYYNGPNCWNRSLTFAKILPTLTYSTSNEMAFWMQSPLCVEKRLDEELAAGDIIAVRSFNSYGETYEIHGFTYISDDISFSKNGYRKNSAYEYYNTSSVFRVYWVPQDCQRVYGQPEKGSACYGRKHARYFSCMSVEEYVESANIRISKQMRNAYYRIMQIDREISKFVFTKRPIIIDKAHFSDLWSELSQFKTAANELLDGGVQDEGVKFFLNALKERTGSLLEQIGIILAY